MFADEKEVSEEELLASLVMESAQVSASAEETIFLINFLRNKVKKYMRRAERWR